ncbi:hypothetical protein [[Eubacterium] cellulosolvens]
MKKLSQIIIVITLVTCIILAGCTQESKDGDEEKKKNKNTSIQSAILFPGKTSPSGNSSYLIVADDEQYLRVSGDCMNPRGMTIIISNFTNSTLYQKRAMYNITIINATLIVDYHASEHYKPFEDILWSLDGYGYSSTNIQPKNYTEDVTESAKLFENESYPLSIINGFTIKFYNPYGGFIAPGVYFDYIWIEIHYTADKFIYD